MGQFSLYLLAFVELLWISESGGGGGKEERKKIVVESGYQFWDFHM